MRLISILLAGTLAMGFAGLAHSQDDDTDKAPVIELADYLDFESVSTPQISPDGNQVLFTRRRVDKMKDRFTSSLWLMDADGTRQRELMKGGAGLWSPSGDRIAFVKKDSNGTPQIHTRFMDAEGLVTQVTSYENAPRSMAWSPDGKHIAFVARVPAKPDWTVDLPGRPKGAKWTKDPAVIDSLHYRQDRVGLTNTGFDHLFVVPAEGGTPRQLTEGEFNVGQRGIGVIAGSPKITWSPDGRFILFDGPGKPVERPNWFESHINIVDIKSREQIALTEGTGTYGEPVLSPDGRKIAFSGYPDHNTSYPVPKLYVMNIDGSDQRVLAEDLPDGPMSLNWSASGKEIYFTMNDAGQRNVQAINLQGRMRDITDGNQVANLSSLSKSGKAALTFTKSDMPGSIAVVSNLARTADLEPLIDVNADILGDKTIGDVEEIWYDAVSEDGEEARVQGWIVYPPDFDPDEKYPLMLSIHGGPHAMSTSGFNFTFQEFAARGYVVLYTNPRGSTGYGDEFANAIRHRYPGPVDYADLMAGVDLVTERGFIDEDRMFVTGCSGGGVLTTWVISQTNRFEAAAALCPVVNWIGMSGTTDVVGWLYNFFPKPFWEDPKPWLDHSTIMQVGSVETPTLLMTGTKDLRTPLGEAEEYFAALKIRGVPTRLIPMEGEYHGTRSIPSNYLRTSLMMRKWFDEHGGGEEESEIVAGSGSGESAANE